MKLFVKGKGAVTLNQSDFVARGGFGAVYAQGSLAYKIYTDPANMIPLDKIDELSRLDHPNIIRPIDPLLDAKNKPVGYDMRYLENTYTLCQLFPKAFRLRNQLTPESVLGLGRRLQELVMKCHKEGAIIVDLNELNVLVEQKLDDLYLIDVDNFKTKSFPAQGLMESVRDRHAPRDSSNRPVYDERSDYFSLAVVLFNLFVGIHPYKGKHPSLLDMEARMVANCSVMNPEVKFPAGSTMPLDAMPEVYLKWFQAVLDRGQRVPPPADLNAVINMVTKVTGVLGSSLLEIVKLFECTDDVIAYYDSSNHPVTVTATELLVNQRHACFHGPGTLVVHTPKSDRPIAARVDDGKLKLLNLLVNAPLPIDVSASQLMVSSGRLYALSGENILEVELIELGARTVATVRVAAAALEKATSLFDGVAIQSLLGVHFASIFPESGVHYQQKLPELNNHKVVDARYRGGVLQVLAVHNLSGQYSRFVYRYSADFAQRDVREVADVTLQGINFVVRDNGVCIQLNEQSELELFSNRPGSPDLKVVADPAISLDMRLMRKGSSIILAHHNEVYSMRMK